MIKDLEFIIKKLFFSESYLLEKRLKRAIKNNYEKELQIIDRFADKTKDALDIGVYRGVYSYKLSYTTISGIQKKYIGRITLAK